METMGDRMRRLRKDMKMTTTEAAEKVGLTQSYYSGIENGKRGNPKIETLTKIANLFDVSMDYLAEGKTVEQPLTDFISVLPPEEAEFVRQHSDDAWIELVKKMTADELTPADVKAMIEAIQTIRGQINK